MCIRDSDNTFRDPKVRGCGNGDIRTMIETGNLSGKCADLNALYVGLARAVGLPARDVYGIRVADSRFGYKSLGKSGNISKAQHCRAEVFLERFGWVPVDPADVRKVVLEEPPGKLALDDPKVRAVREQLFGAWEMNWLTCCLNGTVSVVKTGEVDQQYLLTFQSYDQDGAWISGHNLDIAQTGSGEWEEAGRGGSRAGAEAGWTETTAPSGWVPVTMPETRTPGAASVPPGAGDEPVPPPVPVPGLESVPEPVPVPGVAAGVCAVMVVSSLDAHCCDTHGLSLIHISEPTRQY